MTWIQSVILGIIEGITEFLPVSSTGHMILAGKLLSIPQSEFTKSFEIIIQLGAILAVVVLYFQILVNKRHLWPTLLAAFLPTAFFGFILYSFVKRVLLGNPYIVVFTLFSGGILFLILEYLWKHREFPIQSLSDISIKKAVGIGIIQSLSMIPGVSRSAASIIAGMSLGLNRQTSVEFSFLLAIPTMIAAAGLDILKSHMIFSANDIGMLLIGFTVSFLTALIAIKTFLRFVQTHTFVDFGIYRIIIAVVYYLSVLRT